MCDSVAIEVTKSGALSLPYIASLLRTKEVCGFCGF